mmetsp:Transcript_4364/g.10242  ORF Transcript_4364/g.10242 Transcript_4364/m.10242 type:complete len:238 (-) Transcript_4364:2703-3416(-)
MGGNLPFPLFVPVELLSAILRTRPSSSNFPAARIRRATLSGSVTNPKPRDLPDSRSVGMWHSKTLSLPYRMEKNSYKSAGFVEYAKFPIWSFVTGALSIPPCPSLLFFPLRLRRRDDLEGDFPSFLSSSFCCRFDLSLDFFWSPFSLLPALSFPPPLGAPPCFPLLALSTFIDSDSSPDSSSGMGSSPLTMTKSKSASCFSTDSSNFSALVTPSIEFCKACSCPSYKVSTQLSGPSA